MYSEHANYNAPHEDTKLITSWVDFRRIIERYGFQTLSEKKFLDIRRRYPTQIIAAHRSKKLILVATSSVTDRGLFLNDVSVFGAVKCRRNTLLQSDKAFSQSQGIYHPWGIYEFQFRTRVNLIGRLSLIEDKFKFTNWQNPNPTIWLLNYSEESSEHSDRLWEDKRNEFLASAPAWVREFILPPTIGWSGFVYQSKIKITSVKVWLNMRWWKFSSAFNYSVKCRSFWR